LCLLLLLSSLFLSLGILLLFGLFCIIDVDHAALLHEVLVRLELRVLEERLVVTFMHLPPQVHVGHLLRLLEQSPPATGSVRLRQVRVETPHRTHLEVTRIQVDVLEQFQVQLVPEDLLVDATANVHRERVVTKGYIFIKSVETSWGVHSFSKLDR